MVGISSRHQALHSTVPVLRCPHLLDLCFREKMRVSVSHTPPDNPQVALLPHSFKLNFCGWWWGRGYGIGPFWPGHGLHSILLM